MPRKNPRRGGSRHPADDPREKPYPGYARELKERQDRASLAEQARSNPLPGSLAEAFAGDLPQLHGLTLHPVCGLTTICLKKLESPLLKVLAIIRDEIGKVDEDGDADKRGRAFLKAMAKASARCQKEIKTEPEEAIETIYCFTHPIDDVYARLQQGRQSFRVAAMEAIARRLNDAQVAELELAVAAHYRRSFDTVVNYSAKAGKDDGTVFSRPPSRMTASDGGSTSTVRSGATST